MTRAPSSLLFAIVVSSFGLVAACSQDAGESCQSNSDCDDGLVCCPSGADRSFCGKKEDEECGGGEIVTEPDSGSALDASSDASDDDDASSSMPTDSGQDASSEDGGDEGDGG